MGYRALSPAAIERPRQRNPGVYPDIIGLVYRAASIPAAIERPRQRNPDERSEIIRISVGLLTIRQIDLSRRNGIARPEPIACSCQNRNFSQKRSV